MTQCLVIGRPNAGKTCFTLNFADFLGIKRMQLTIRQPEGFSSTQSFMLSEARERLISSEPNQTKRLQSITLSLPRGKGRKKIELIDSCGLSDGIHPCQQIRKAMAQTINRIKASIIVLHIIDLSRFKPGKKEIDNLIDNQINSYASQQPAYCILANKIDLPLSRRNLPPLRRLYSSSLIIPLSALHKKGFSDVKHFLWKNI